MRNKIVVRQQCFLKRSKNVDEKMEIFFAITPIVLLKICGAVHYYIMYMQFGISLTFTINCHFLQAALKQNLLNCKMVIIYLMMCYMCLERKEKYEYYLTGNNIINLKIQIKIMKRFLVCHYCSQKQALFERPYSLNYWIT